jgi:DNA adenine methylase
MIISSPLRYPGGKSTLASLLSGIRRVNGLSHHVMAEPFAGGAGASLTLLYLEEFRRIHINDADPSIFAFWWALTHRSDLFLRRLSDVRVSMAEWYRQRALYRCKRPISRLSRGFAAFFLNRCNRSGIVMNGGPIGGVGQIGRWKLGARFNRGELLRRCEKVIDYRERIAVSGDDGLELLKTLDCKTTFFFIDPPYFEKGPALYLNALDQRYHSSLAEVLRGMPNAAWVLTYDDCPEIRRMYRGWAAIRPFSLNYSAAERRTGNEVLITPRWMRLPVYQESEALRW